MNSSRRVGSGPYDHAFRDKLNAAGNHQLPILESTGHEGFVVDALRFATDQPAVVGTGAIGLLVPALMAVYLRVNSPRVAAVAAQAH